MITSAAAAGLRDGVNGSILHEVASERWKLLHRS